MNESPSPESPADTAPRMEKLPAADTYTIEERKEDDAWDSVVAKNENTLPVTVTVWNPAKCLWMDAKGILVRVSKDRKRCAVYVNVGGMVSEMQLDMPNQSGKPVDTMQIHARAAAALAGTVNLDGLTEDPAIATFTVTNNEVFIASRADGILRVDAEQFNGDIVPHFYPMRAQYEERVPLDPLYLLDPVARLVLTFVSEKDGKYRREEHTVSQF